MKIGVYNICLEEGDQEALSILLDDCDYIFAIDEESLRSLEMLVPASKAKLMPSYTNNQESFESWIKEESGRDDIEFIGYAEMAEATGFSVSEEEDDKKIVISKEKGQEMAEEMRRRLTPGMRDALDTLGSEMQDLEIQRESLKEMYIMQCQEQGLEQEQSRKEAQQFMTTDIPAEEFIAPVGVLQPLKDGMDGFDFKKFL
jgi:hypothetical protein